MVGGTDYLSMHRSNGPVVVDDFRSDGRPILGFHWWGSYFSDDPVLQPLQDRQVAFEISFHTDCPAGTPVTAQCPGLPVAGAPDQPYPFSTPGQPYQFQLVSAEESFFGSTQLGERVYEYWALLPAPWDEVAGNVYWVDVAWAAGQFGTDPNGAIWGWHESDQHWNDAAVTTNPPSPGGNPHQGPWMLVAGGNRDMAFEVLTTPEPGTLGLLGLGILGLASLGRRKARAG